MEFRKFIEQNTTGYHNDGPGSGFSPYGGSFVSSDFSGSNASDTMHYTGRPLHLPGTDMIFPLTKKTGKVISIEVNKNPISIRMEDGTQLYLSWDEYNRIKGKKPRHGDIITVNFRRLPDDVSKESSTIENITVH